MNWVAVPHYPPRGARAACVATLRCGHTVLLWRLPSPDCAEYTECTQCWYKNVPRCSVIVHWTPLWEGTA